MNKESALEVAEFKRQMQEYEASRPKKRKKNTKPTNSLTKAVITLLRSKGYYAARINTTGIYNKKRKQWVRMGSTLGVADVLSCIEGYFVAVEIKYGKDTQSPEQKEQERLIKMAKGIYVITGNIDEFIKQLEEIERFIELKGK